jgi:hypothetical protein
LLVWLLSHVGLQSSMGESNPPYKLGVTSAVSSTFFGDWSCLGPSDVWHCLAFQRGPWAFHVPGLGRQLFRCNCLPDAESTRTKQQLICWLISSCWWFAFMVLQHHVTSVGVDFYHHSYSFAPAARSWPL